MRIPEAYKRTAERCTEISPGVRVFCAPLEYVDNSGIRTLKGCRGLLAPFQGPFRVRLFLVSDNPGLRSLPLA